MCCLEDIANWATILGALVATATLIVSFLTFKRARSIELVVSQKKELFDALTRLHDFVISMRERTDDQVETRAFIQLLSQCEETQRIITENKFSAGKAERHIQEISRIIKCASSDWETSKEEEKDLNEVATNLMNKYFSAVFDSTIVKIQKKLR